MDDYTWGEYTWDDMVENLKKEYKDTVTEAEKLAKLLDEYISKDRVIDALCLDCAEESKCKDFCDNAKRILYLPAADVAPVVRCKDCKFWESDDETGGGWCYGLDIVVENPDFFCASGKRGVNKGGDV